MGKKQAVKQYKTLAELKAAYESGELDPEAGRLVLDNDVCQAYVKNPDYEGEDEDDVDWISVFRSGGPSELLPDALDLLGIPWEFC